MEGPVLYRARRRFGLSALTPVGSALAVVLLSLAGGGCSLSRNSAAFAEMEGDRDVTGSLRHAAVAETPKMPTDADLAFARNAASDVLTKGGKDSSQPWENPATGARGSVTPIATAYTAEGRTCRNVLASYVNGKSESWWQGVACQSGRGRWDVQSLKPWKQA